jgi:hypothetical protein
MPIRMFANNFTPNAGFGSFLPVLSTLSDESIERLRAGTFHLLRRNNARRATAITFSFLGKLFPVGGDELDHCTELLGALLDESLAALPVHGLPLIAGLAESGIVPSGLMFRELRRRGIEARWACSSRRPVAGIRFTEPHSHGPHHILPRPAETFDELWIVEDELTTGATLTNLVLRLCHSFEFRRVRVFALLDARDDHRRAQFARMLAHRGIESSVHTILREDTTEPTVSEADVPPPPVFDADHSLPCRAAMDWHDACARSGVKLQTDFGTFERRETTEEGTLLVIGEAIDLAIALVAEHPGLAFQHVTLSPWQVDRLHIHDCLAAAGYHLYNPRAISGPVRLLADPIDRPVAEAFHAELVKRGVAVAPLDE